LTDFDLTAAIRSHEERGAEATIALTSVENPLAFGIVIADETTGRIERFLEKPTWGEVFSDTINTGIYILEPAALERVPPRTNVDFSKDLYPQMLREGAELYGYVATGYWRDIGNIDAYRIAHHDLLAGRVQLELPGSESRHGDGTVWLDDSVTLGENVTIR